MAHVDPEQVKKAYEELGSVRGVASALGIDRDVVIRVVDPDRWRRRLDRDSKRKRKARENLKGPKDGIIKPAVPELCHVRRVSSYLNEDGSVHKQWVIAEPDKQAKWDAFWDAAREHAAKYENTAAPISSPRYADDDLLTIYPLGDPHIGLLSWEPETGESHDLKIAESDLMKTVDLLVGGAPTSKRASLINLGDFFHAQTDAQLTPRGGNKLDVDGRRERVFRVGFTLMHRLIMRMLGKHEVVGVFNVPGNHDPEVAILLELYLEAFYRNEPRVVVQKATSPYQYERHGKVLIGYAHGDGCKPEMLPGIMATERREDWGQTLYQHWITGHVHHKNVFLAKEFSTCLIESFNTLAGKDYWHRHSGYNASRYLNAITYHREWGEVTRSKVDLRLSRAA